MADGMDRVSFNEHIERMRKIEYPMLNHHLYLDHGATTLYNKTTMDRFHAEMMANLYGNPHSASPSSQRSIQNIDSARLSALTYFGADPDVFDLVFTANTTAAIKLVMNAFREQDHGFCYGYHVDAHTSLIGVREVAVEHQCLISDREVEQWLDSSSDACQSLPRLFAYPAQSNLSGRRLPLDWLKVAHTGRCYSLLDAAAYVATSPLLLDDLEHAPDFTVLSFAKIFGFPDLAALIVKKQCAPVFERRRYFGGGTVDLVACVKEEWHVTKSGSLHVRLEDGTLPVHSIVALQAAMKTQFALFRSLDDIAQHLAWLTKRLHESLATLKHHNEMHVCKMYTHQQWDIDNTKTQGPTIAFNIVNSQGEWVSNAEVAKLAAIQNIHLRTGGLCNPGGVSQALELSPWQMRENFSAGFRCGNEQDVMNGKPTGVIRVSLGAMSTMDDVERFVDFMDQFFVDKTPTLLSISAPSGQVLDETDITKLYVESLTVYPIKSCAGWQVPYGEPWDIRQEGLAWDREWCIVKQGSGTALSQKAYPRMALIRPHFDFKTGVLRIRLVGSTEHMTVPLSKDPTYFSPKDNALSSCNVSVCGDKVQARMYTSPDIAAFFTSALGVACTLARFPAASQTSPSTRRSKYHLAQRLDKGTRPILLSNESPILTISRSSLNRLNEMIKAKGGKAAHHAVFRANIIVAENLPPCQERPWSEDGWESMLIGDGAGQTEFDVLGGCRRCQMVCVDQKSGERDQEPFVTLAKTRRFGGRVLFGVHTALKDGTVGRISSGSPIVTRSRT